MSEIIIFQTADSQTQVEVKFENETVWLSQSQIAELFQRERTVITKHINNVFKEDELDKKSNVQKMHIAFFLQFTFVKDVTDVLGNNGSVALK